MPHEPNAGTPTSVKTTSSSQSRGQWSPDTAWPITTTRPTWTTALAIAVDSSPPKYASGGHRGGELEVDVLERGPRHRQVLEPLAALEGLAGQPVEQLGRVVGVELDPPAVDVVGDAVARAVGGQLARRALGHDQPVLDDRDA